MGLRALIGFSLIGFILAEDDILLKPIKRGTQEVGLVFIQGAQIENSAYLPVLTAIQKASPYSLWIGSPHLPLDLANPLVLGNAVQSMLSQMRAAGMNTTKLFYAGHSLGGAMLQDYAKSSLPTATGLILMGSFLERKYNYSKFGIPTLTIGGELDGLCRVTRLMESHYHQITKSDNIKEAAESYPVVIVNGMCHFQFASGEPPALVKARDLKPEISFNEAYFRISKTVADFISVRVDGNTQAVEAMTTRVADTGKWLEPLVTAFLLEGSYHFKQPCYEQKHTTACQIGCPWTETVAQRLMGNLSTIVLDATDEFHQVWKIPFHLPAINNKCKTEIGCRLNVSTVTQATYEQLDSVDTGFASVSAFELRVKMKSRQAIWEAVGRTKVDFNKTDKQVNICAAINQMSYEKAMNMANLTTLSRFMKHGRKMKMGVDLGPYNAGPLWIWNPIQYNNDKDSAGRNIVVVQSPMMYTPTDYSIKLSAGFHYCKLMSPARALEWIYVDSLRPG